MSNGDGRHHLNVPLVWLEGLTGRGVFVLVLDDCVAVNVWMTMDKLLTNGI